MKKKLLIIIVFAIIDLSAKAQWTQTNGVFGGSVNCMAANGTNIFAAVNGIVSLTTDNGNTWVLRDTGMTATAVRALSITGSNIFAATDTGVYLSSNNGSTWAAVNTGLTNHNAYSLAISGSNIFAATLGRGVFLSSNNGGNWSAVNTGLTDTAILSLAINGTTIFAGTDSGKVFLSTNNGSSWTPASTGLPPTGYVNSLVISGTNIIASTGAGIYLSTNNGSNWTSVLSAYTYSLLAISGTTNVFAGTNTGVSLSTDNGATWNAVDTGLPVTFVWSLVANGTNIFAGTGGNGVWKRSLSEMTGISELQNESSFVISPNPFTSQTTISFSEIQKNTTIKIMDLEGRIINDKLLIINRKSATLDMSGYAKCIYFVQIIVDSAGSPTYNVVNRKVVVQ